MSAVCPLLGVRRAESNYKSWRYRLGGNPAGLAGRSCSMSCSNTRSTPTVPSSPSACVSTGSARTSPRRCASFRPKAPRARSSFTAIRAWCASIRAGTTLRWPSSCPGSGTSSKAAIRPGARLRLFLHAALALRLDEGIDLDVGRNVVCRRRRGRPPRGRNQRCRIVRKPALLAFVPDIRRELPVAPAFFRYHSKFAGNFLQVSALRHEGEGSDLTRRDCGTIETAKASEKAIEAAVWWSVSFLAQVPCCRTHGARALRHPASLDGWPRTETRYAARPRRSRPRADWRSPHLPPSQRSCVSHI